MTPSAVSSTAMLARLVAHRTVSSDSNLALIEDVRRYLESFGVVSRLVPNADGTKANLVATIGPAVAGGAVLSGHTDVVPVEGQPWSSDPFALIERDGRLYGRGSSDMKGFIACALAAVPALVHAKLQRPIHLCLSYDEEIGCFGAPHAIELFGRELPQAALCIVGEPTMMRVVVGHKSSWVNRVSIVGREAHSSAPHLGANAIVYMGRFLGFLDSLQVELRAKGLADAVPGVSFDPPWTTLGIGLIHGGTAANIVARECALTWEFRALPGANPEAIYAQAAAKIAELDAAIKKEAPEASVSMTRYAAIPSLKPEIDGPAAKLALALTGANRTETVAFGTEAGQFQAAGISTVICGPGDIAVAHKTDEYTTRDQLAQCDAFIAKLADWASRPA
ncbi:MAG: acetylornithine deacetylase [Magnetospirillum sp.]|jgi:acetylornithine deacetylase|nr:acetylornithine deacetylase [Magnetospirillum sp.]